MPSLNRVFLVGEVAAKPEVLRADEPALHITFPVATERDHMANGEKKQVTDIHRVVAVGVPAAALLDSLKKGMLVAVEGELLNRGLVVESEKRFITEIHTESVKIIAAKGIREARP